MIKEFPITQTSMIRKKFCDECEKEIKIDMACSIAKCEICGKDLCEDCIGYEQSNSGDYRTVYCKSCWDIGKSYREQIEHHEKEIDRLNEEWIKSCKKRN